MQCTSDANVLWLQCNGRGSNKPQLREKLKPITRAVNRYVQLYDSVRTQASRESVTVFLRHRVVAAAAAAAVALRCQVQAEAGEYQASLEAEVEEERRHSEHQLRLLARSNEAEIQEVRLAYLPNDKRLLVGGMRICSRGRL